MVENPTSEVSVLQEDNRYFQFQSIWLKTGIKSRKYWLKTGIKSWKYLRVSSRKGISKQILDRGYYSIKLQKEGQKDLQSHRYSKQMQDHMFIK